jgi:transcriptional regulator with XRE-family HTH domain
VKLPAETVATVTSVLDELPGMVAAVRADRSLSLRDAAEQSGVSYITLHHVEHGGNVQTGTLRALLAWMTERDTGK